MYKAKTTWRHSRGRGGGAAYSKGALFRGGANSKINGIMLIVLLIFSNAVRCAMHPGQN